MAAHRSVLGLFLSVLWCCTGRVAQPAGESAPAAPAAPVTCSDFSAEVLPALKSGCQGCHQGPLAPGNFYIGPEGAIVGNREAIADAVSSERMPPKGSPALSPENRKVIDAWLEPSCFAPTASNFDFSLPRFSETENQPTRLSPLQIDNTLFAAVGENMKPARELSNEYEATPVSAFDSTAYLELRSFARTSAQRFAALKKLDGFQCSNAQTAPKDCPSLALQTVAARIFRRPLTTDEAKQFETVRSRVEALTNAEIGLSSAVEALLMSPQFLYQLSTGGTNKAAELASRLSFFLRDEPPDESLAELVKSGAILSSEGRKAYVRKVLDPKQTPIHGIAARYYLGYEREVLSFSRTEPASRKYWYMWFGTTDKDPELLAGGSKYSMVWDTIVEAPEAGDFSFHIGCGFSPLGTAEQPTPHIGAVFFDGIQVANGEQCKSKRFWDKEGATGFEFTKTLRKSARHRLTVEAQGWAGENPMFIAWVRPGKVKEDIPISSLYVPPEASLRGVQRAFAEFGGYADLRKVVKDVNRYPLFTEQLRSMQREQADLMVSNAMSDQTKGLSSLFALKSIPLNDLTQAAWNIPVEPKLTRRFANTEVPAPYRGGWLSSAAVFAGNSGPLYASFVKLGTFVRTRLMCLDLPPPPPGVEQNVETSVQGNLTLAQKLKQHSDNVNCYGCHRAIDPVGLPFMRYDSVGRFVGEANGIDAQAQGSFAENGVRFNDVPQLSQALIGDVRVSRCLTSRLFETALHSPRRERFREDIERIALPLSQSQQTLAETLVEVVGSDSFANP
jgi:Protein of unknown function (DUF1588)/Protein of unknown function (DUF1595)/Protein of unknown function (DUF1592)